MERGLPGSWLLWPKRCSHSTWSEKKKKNFWQPVQTAKEKLHLPNCHSSLVHQSEGRHEMDDMRWKMSPFTLPLQICGQAQIWSHTRACKMVCITTDNGANLVATTGKLGWPWLYCFGHNLHLAVSHLVNTFNLSWINKRDLRKAQTETNLHQHSLILVSDG